MKHPNWRPAQRTPAPIAQQSQPARVQVPVGKTPPAHRLGELVGKRTATARYFELSDGRVQAEVSADAVNYRDGNGHFQPIDTAVKPVSRPGFAYGDEQNVFGSYFGRDRSKLVQVVPGGHTLTMAAPAAGVLTPVVTGNTVVYRGALGGADLGYDVTSTALKERIVLAGAPKDPTYTFTLDLGGLTAKQRADGSIALYGADGPPVAVVPQPFMADSKPDRNSPYGTGGARRSARP